MSNNNVVFIYGTLRTGYENHQLLYNAFSLGNGWTVSDDFVMRALRTPYVSDAKGNVHEATRIFGELYALSDYELKQIDDYYSAVESSRRLVEIDVIGDGTITAWMYMNNNRTDGYVILSGNYSDFRSPGEI